MPDPVTASIAAATTLGTAYMNSRAAGKAAKAQGKAANRAADVEWKMYKTTREDLAPWRDVGKWALNQIAGDVVYDLPKPKKEDFYTSPSGAAPGVNVLSQAVNKLPVSVNLMRYMPAVRRKMINKMLKTGTVPAGLGGGATTTSQPVFDKAAYDEAMQKYLASGRRVGGLLNDPSLITKTPGYQFRLGEGIKALDRSAAARGRLRSGAQVKAITKFGQDYATNEYDNMLRRFYNLAGVGQNATTTTGQFGQYAGNALAQGYLGAGQARASGYINKANAITGPINQGTNALMTYYMLKNLKG